jgi:hypothetical protein
MATKKTRTQTSKIRAKNSKKSVKKKREPILNDEGKDISRYITKGKGNIKDFEKSFGLLKDTGIKPFKR